MATPESIAIRRSNALDRVAKATGQIAAVTGCEIAPYPDPHKREEMRPAIEAEWLADALEAIAAATGSPIEGDLLEMEVFDIDATIGAAYARYDSDERASGPDDFDAFKEALTEAFALKVATEDAEIAPDLARLNRADLDAYAAEQGMTDTSAFKTKAELIAALDAHAAQKETDEMDGTTTPTTTPAPQPEPVPPADNGEDEGDAKDDGN